MMMYSVLGWFFLGLFAGFIARILYPVENQLGMEGTIILAILGSVIGGYLAYMLRFNTNPHEPAGWVFAALGAVALLGVGIFGGRTPSPV